jgi:hypothetical protein
VFINNIQQQLLGPYVFCPEVLKERNEAAAYYNFYHGPASSDESVFNDLTKGQSWMVPAGLDFKPSQDIRNHTKKLLQKQARFMFGKPPDILFKPMDKKDKDKAEALRQFIDNIFEDNSFWSDTKKAFLDTTIAKRVLLRVQANPGQPIKLCYHTIDEFTYEVDPSDYKKVTQIIIAYMEKSTADKPYKDQIWYRWKYYMKNNICHLIHGTYNGLGEPIKETEIDTLLDEIPCKVILNGGLTGDIQGTSDLKDLIDLQDAYNHTLSDFRDALRFKMFEQPVFTDADSESLENIKIAPNAMIDLKTDPAAPENAKADAKMLSSTFNFVEAAKEFTSLTKADMYELMDQPRPEDVKQVPSAKALKFTFYDLIGRCEDKWQDGWEDAIKWMVKFILKCVKQFNLYPGIYDSTWNDLKFSIIVNHNYPIPEDEEDKKKIALEEIMSNVRSRKSYIKDFSDDEDFEGLYQEILTEIEEIQHAEQSMFQKSIRNGD